MSKNFIFLCTNFYCTMLLCMHEKPTIVTTAIAPKQAYKKTNKQLKRENLTDNLKILEQAALYLALQYYPPQSLSRRQCPVCKKIFANYRNMQRHFQNLHTRTRYQPTHKKSKNKNNT